MSAVGSLKGAVKITLHSANNDVDEKAEVTVALNNPEQAVEKMFKTLAQRFPPESVVTITPGSKLGSENSDTGSRVSRESLKPLPKLSEYPRVKSRDDNSSFGLRGSRKSADHHRAIYDSELARPNVYSPPLPSPLIPGMVMGMVPGLVPGFVPADSPHAFKYNDAHYPTTYSPPVTKTGRTRAPSHNEYTPVDGSRHMSSKNTVDNKHREFIGDQPSEPHRKVSQSFQEFKHSYVPMSRASVDHELSNKDGSRKSTRNTDKQGLNCDYYAQRSHPSVSPDFSMLQPGFGEYVETLPDGSRVRYVEVEVHEEREVKVEVPVFHERVAYESVPVVQPKEVIQYVDDVVEVIKEVPVPHEVERVVNEKVKKTQEVPVQVVVEKKVDIPRKVDKIVEVPQYIEVERPYEVEERVPVQRYVQREVPCVVAQKLRPLVRETGKVRVDTKTYEPVLYAVDVYIPKPVGDSIRLGARLDETHQKVVVPPAQYNSLINRLNPHLERKAIEEVCMKTVEGHIPMLPAGEIDNIVEPHSTAWRNKMSHSLKKHRKHNRHH